MDPIKHLQETLEESLMEMNKEAMKALAAQIAATVTQLQNGEPSRVMLMWEAGKEPDAIKQFISDNSSEDYSYSVLMPTGRATLPWLALQDMEVLSLDLPQNKLLLYYYP